MLELNVVFSFTEARRPDDVARERAVRYVYRLAVLRIVHAPQAGVGVDVALDFWFRGAEGGVLVVVWAGLGDRYAEAVAHVCGCEGVC